VREGGGRSEEEAGVVGEKDAIAKLSSLLPPPSSLASDL
jgi:hypothetical protein